MTITMKDVEEYRKIIEERKQSSTYQESRQRLIDSGYLDKDGKVRTYQKNS